MGLQRVIVRILWTLYHLAFKQSQAYIYAGDAEWEGMARRNVEKREVHLCIPEMRHALDYQENKARLV